MTQQEWRLKEARERTAHWRRWGPYLSERQWGTVRENYSANGTAWEYFPHDHARSRPTAGASHQTGWTSLAAMVLQRSRA